MSRYLFVLISVFPFMFLFNPTEIKKEELKVELQVPANAEPGSQVTVQLKITGGDVKGFAKYTDRLPEGYEAVSAKLGDATFTADNGQIKIIWLEFPKDDEVVVEYVLKTPSTANGNIELGGKFSYLENNEKRVFSVFKKSLTVGSVAIAAAEEAEEEAEVAVTVEVHRQILNSKENIHHVQLTVTQSGLDGFGKIQEFVPLGAVIEKGEVENAVFSSIKNKVKFVWMSLPKKESFVVTYYVDLSKADSKDINSLTGNFSYLDNDVSKKVDIIFDSEGPILASNSIEEKVEEAPDSEVTEKEETEEVANEGNQTTEESNETEEKIAVVTPAAVGVVAGSNVEATKDEKENLDIEAEDEGTEIALNEKETLIEEVEVEEETEMKASTETIAVAEENVESEKQEEEIVDELIEEEVEDEIAKVQEEEIEEESVKSSTSASKEKETPIMNSSNSPVVSGVKYRVQIAAGANVVDAAYFQDRHNFTSAFNVENHQGWVKYTTGSYTLYKDARDSRENINGSGHKFDGPFVTAYNDGTRITVQEALMISSQKWYK